MSRSYDGGRIPEAAHNPRTGLQFQLDGGINNLAEILADLVQAGIDQVNALIKKAIDAIVGFVTDPATMIEALQDWVQGIPVLDTIVAAITGLTGGGLGLGELGTFFTSIRDFFSVINFNSTSFDPGDAITKFIQLLLIPTNLLAKLVGGFIPGINIPALDASKIVSGQFLEGLIPGLDASKIISGIFGGGLIPGLDASKIISGTFLDGLIPGLDVSKIVSGIFGSARIPSLDASKITSGQFPQTMVTGLVDALAQGAAALIDKIVNTLRGTSGSGFDLDDISDVLSNFPGANIVGSIASSIIPGLDASKIISGVLGGSLIPNLDAGKITSGIFGGSLIPGLDASKIISGVFGTGLIPNLDASKIISGVLNVLRIPGLDASQIISGSFAGSMISGPIAAVTDLATSIWQGFGGSGSGNNTNVQSVINNYQTRITSLEGGGTLTSFGSNGTWNNPTPSAHNKIMVRLYNGGQGGAKPSTTTGAPAARGGLGGGCVELVFYTDEIASSVAITVGSGTAGATSTGGVPAAGGVSKFGSYGDGAADTGDLNLKPGRGGNGANMQGANGLESPEYGEGNRYVARSAPGGGTTAGSAGANAPSGTSCGGAGGGGGGGQSGSPVTGAAGGAGGAPGGGGGGGGRGGSNIGNGGNAGAGRVDVFVY